jgi:hypothetical protein
MNVSRGLLLRSVLVLLVAAVVVAGAANAIVGGQLDGNRHPSVGFMIGYDEEGRPFYGCSGTLVTQTLFVTAAHCAGGEPDLIPAEVRVVFDSQVPLASDGRPNPSVYVTGTPHPNPRFVHGGSELGLTFAQIAEDYGVVVLDRAASKAFPNVRTSPLTSADLVKKTVSKQRYELVGYGLSALGSKGNFKERAFDGFRRFAVAEANGNSLIDPSVLALNENANGSDGTDGDIDSGDSGGAVLANGTLVAVISAHSWGGWKSYAARLDTPQAMAFLSQYPDGRGG